MTDLREKIAQTIITKGQPGGVMIACRNANEVADAILAAIKDSIPPLVWVGGGERYHVSGEHCVVMWSDDACRWIADCWFTASIGGWDTEAEGMKAVEALRTSTLLAAIGIKQ